MPTSEHQSECTSCGRPADERQKCRSCRKPTCMRCACYDEDGRLYCLDCVEDAAPMPSLPFGGRFG